MRPVPTALTQPGAAWLPPAALLAYTAVFFLTRGGDPGAVGHALARNTSSLLIAASLAWVLLDRLNDRLEGIGRWWHAAIAAGFSLLWLWLVTLAAAIGEAGSLTAFIMTPFLPLPAAEWQLLQGVFAYAALAAIHDARRVRASAAALAEPTPAARPEPRACLLVKVGDEILPVPADEIVCITGADDYAELTTTTRRHLVRTTLAEFTEQLDERRFVRIHRSAIVNLQRIVRAEPAGGGRMTVHVERGDPLVASRAGARLLRGAIA